MKLVIGVDFGTLSARAVLVDASSGATVAEACSDYKHGVMDEKLPSGKRLPDNYALQHPADYIDALKMTVDAVLMKAGVNAESVIGIGIDFTSCTLLPIDESGVPLCFREEYKNEPHAYVKLWKHHAAQGEADEITALAEKRNEKWLSIYGGRISSEWALPKILQILREAPSVYNDAYRFIEAGDWISLLLTGKETHCAAFAGYKWLWNADSGYPDNGFLTALDNRLDGIVGTKICDRVLGVDSTAGVVCKKGAELFGLKEGTAVALPMIDAHAALPALNIVDDGELIMIVGTSTCHILNSVVGKSIEGICGYVKDGVIPGYYTYEAGQASVGDTFEWFIKNCVPHSYVLEAEERGISIHKLLREKASSLKAGENGLLALDWFNGNRSTLVNSRLKGMVLGMNLQTKPEDIYRALIEATAFGTGVILEQYESCGIVINKICAGGGIAQKDEMMMQIYADVLGREIAIAGSSQAGALGSAIYAAVAAGIYPDLKIAAAALARQPLKVYTPNLQEHRAYTKLYSEYKRLYDYFGKGENNVMMEL